MKRRGPVNYWAMLVFAGICAFAAMAADSLKPVATPKLALTETEQLKLDNLKLRSQLLQSQVQALQTQVQQAQGTLQSDAAAFAAKTLKDHNVEATMQWSVDKMDFEPVQKPEVPAAKK